MIVKNGKKSKQVYVDGKRIYQIYHGFDLVYNCYAIPQTKVITLSNATNNTGDETIKSNTNWTLS